MSDYAAKRIAEIESSREGTRRGYVYFISDGDSMKIGFTGDVDGRLAALRTASAKPLHLIEICSTHIETEALLHRHFASDRLNGEWFRMSLAIDDLMGAIFDYQGQHWSEAGEPEELTDVFMPVSAFRELLRAAV